MKWFRKKQNIVAQKSADLGSWSPLAPWITNDYQFTRSKWGAAKAYVTISYVEKCVELIASGITSLPYIVKRFSINEGSDTNWKGREIARSDDPKPSHPLFQLFHDYENKNNVPLMLRAAISLTLYDELFIELIRKNEGYPVGQYNPLLGLDWLNPLGVSINASGGEINQYFYSPYDTSKSVSYEPFEIVYKHGYNPEDDLRGYPDVLAVLESLEIDAAIQTAVVSHFRNGIQSGGVASPKDGFSNLSHVKAGLEKVTNTARGPEQVGNILFWPKAIDYTATPYPDYSQLTEYSQDTVDRILDQFGVPRAMLGNSDIAGYKQGDEVTYRFYVSNILPRADDIVRFFNRRIIPLLPYEYHLDRLVVDRSEFDRVNESDIREADIVGRNLQNSIITINEARKRQGLEEFEPERGDLLIVPMGTVFVSPDDLKSGFIAGGTSEEAIVTEQTSDIETDEGLSSVLPDDSEDVDTPLPPPDTTDMSETEIPEEQSETQKSHLLHVKSVMSKSLVDIQVWDWTVDKAHKELDTIYRFMRRRGPDGLKHLPEFDFNYTRGDIADVLLKSFEDYDREKSGVTVKSIFEKIKEWVAIKAIQTTRIEFEDDFEDVLQALIDKRATTQQASARLRNIIRKANNKAYRDGLADGGAVDEEPSDEEQIEINQFIASQSQYVKDLLQDVKNDKYESAQGKGAQWYTKSVKPMYDAGLASVAGNMMVEWVLGRTEKHCRSCLGYNGQRHRFKSWLRIAAMPGSDTLACNGFNCDCKLVPVKAAARGKLKLIKSIYELMEGKRND